MSYAWIIDRDHLDEQYQAELTPDHGPYAANADVGLSGPGEAPDWMLDALRETGNADGGASGDIAWTLDQLVPVDRFQMPDDGILYYTGRMLTDDGPTENACSGPLRDCGGPGPGCVAIAYPGLPEMDCS